VNTVTGNVWTETDNGWVTRPCTAGDAHRRSLLASWMRGDLTIDQVTHKERRVHYADVLEQVRKHKLTVAECAP